MKERYEWIQSWCDETTQTDKKRLLLIGDSITAGYQTYVRKLLINKYYVDYIALSYSADSSIYKNIINDFFYDSDYTFVHFNHGLHGQHMSKELYKENVSKILDILQTKCKFTLATSTIVFNKGLLKINEQWNKLIDERNRALSELASDYNCKVNDLHFISRQIDIKNRKDDGFHYTDEGYKIFANKVASIYLENNNK